MSKYERRFKHGEFAKIDNTLIKIVSYGYPPSLEYAEPKVCFTFVESGCNSRYWTKEYNIEKIENQKTVEVLFGNRKIA